MEPFRMSLRAARVNAEMSMDDACKALHVSKGTMSNWENGVSVPPADKAIMLAELYKTPLNCINFCRKSSI